MNDIFQRYGSDITTSSTGDLQPVDGSERGQQRIIRRLLTNPGDYIFHPEYGAGLPAKIGDTVDIPNIRALIRGQMLLEESVAKIPEPQVTINAIPGGIGCVIRYADAQTKTPAVLSFNVNR